MLYATDGLGKSTFASCAPSPIFVGAEDGTAELDVVRMPDIFSWRDIIDSVIELQTADHSYKSFVLDTADWAEPMNWLHVCAANKWTDLDEPGYGRGPAAALAEWRILLAELDRLRERRGMHILVLAHSWIKTFKNPESAGDFDRYELALNPKAAGLLKQWADCVLFGAYETLTHTDKNKRTRGVSTGARVLHTQRTAAWDAKNRYDLPPTLPLDWEAFAEAVAAHRPASPEQLKARIAKLLESADDTLRARAVETVERAGDDAAQLARIADRLQAAVSINGGQGQ